MVAAVLAVLLVGFLLVLGLLGGSDDEPGSADKASTTPTNTAARTTPKPKPKPAVSGVNVVIAPAEATYVCVDRGAGTPVLYEGTLEQKRTFKDKKALRVNLGKRGLVVTVNGKKVTIPDSSEPVGFEFTQAATKELPAGSRPCA